MSLFLVLLKGPPPIGQLFVDCSCVGSNPRLLIEAPLMAPRGVDTSYIFVLLHMPCDRRMQVKTAEGFSKRELFEKLAPLEEATRPLMQKARQTLGQAKGQSALQPWNIGYSLSGVCFTAPHTDFPFLCETGGMPHQLDLACGSHLRP